MKKVYIGGPCAYSYIKAAIEKITISQYQAEITKGTT